MLKYRPRKKRVAKIRGKQVDYTDMNNVFYKEYFTSPRDSISYRFKELLKVPHYQAKFPQLLLDGLPNLKPKVLAPFRRIPKLSLLREGKYEAGTSNSDIKVTSKSIQFFLNQLPSFAKYRTVNDLDWVIREHRLLALEIFEHYKDAPKTSLCTFEQRFNSILRIMRIAYRSKTQPIYKLFSTIVFQLHGKFVRREGENKLNEREENKFIHWEDVLTIQKTMEEKFNAMPDKNTQKAYDYNNDLVLISLYCLMPSLRNELKHMEFRSHPRYKDVDYVYINKNQTKVILKFNLDKKQHGEINFDLTDGEFKNDHLANILRQSYSLYKRDYLFTLKNKYPKIDEKASEKALDERLINIFFKHGIENQITVNSLRSSFISYVWSNPKTTINDKKLIAVQMRSSLYCLDTFYNKIHDKIPILCNTKKCRKNCSDLDDTSNSSDNSENDNDICYNDDDDENKNDSNDENDENDENEEDNQNNDNEDDQNDDDNDRENKDQTKKHKQPKSMKECFLKCCNNLCKEKYKKYVKHMNHIDQNNQDNNNDDDNMNDDNNDNDQNDNDDYQNDDNDNNQQAKLRNNNIPEKPKLTQYQKKLLRNKQYYEKNKEKIIKKVTENKNKKQMTPFEKTRERIMQLLNASPDYAQKIKKTTIEKYKFIYDNETKRWKWEE
jgi:hypothetical protein